MAQDFVQYINIFFKRLIDTYGFKITSELNEKQSYMIEFSSQNYTIKIEKYFREFYASIYRFDEPDNRVNIFNLLEYLRQNSTDIPRSEYFKKEKNIEECYRKQLNHISTIIYENYNLINDFFNSNDYQSKIIDFEKYWKTKHPEFYKK